MGDAFGERFFVHPDVVEQLIEQRAIPRSPWRTTDDTEMSLAIVDVLERHALIDRDALAIEFARRYTAEIMRGYGGTAHKILREIGLGRPWRDAAGEVFSGQGSMGNGGAMRAAPVGAYFADDVPRVVAEASASAEVTHAHPDGQAGAIAVALAAAWAVRHGDGGGKAMLEFVAANTPSGPTLEGIVRAMALDLDRTPQWAAHVLGSGKLVISSDTVPFALWCAARHLDSFEEAMWTTVAGLGDRDTTCAIVGGIVALAAGHASIPAEWLAARESFVRSAS